MARHPTNLKKSVKLHIDKLRRKCRYCKTHTKDARVSISMKLVQESFEDPRGTSRVAHPFNWQELQAKEMPLISPTIPASLVYSSVSNEFACVEGSSSMPMDLEYGSPELGHPTTAPSLRDPVVAPRPMPQEYIKIYLDGLDLRAVLRHSFRVSAYMPQPEPRPWAPFENLADFEYTETLYWLGEREQTYHQDFTEMDKVLSKARKYFVQFQSGIVTATCHVIQDESLAPMAMWNAVRKYYCSGDFEERIYDEPNTADTWWNIDGLVTRRVKKYPMLLRPAWLPRQIRNASGNGGGVLLGYMPIVEDPSDPSSRSATEKEEFAHFKREVYQKILKKVFRSLKRPSQNGEAHRCGDGLNRVLYPGILIESQDAEEAAYFCGCRAASANHPCPKCLVAHSDLHDILGDFELRMPQSMQSVLIKVSETKTKTAKEIILKDNGMHNIEVRFQNINFRSPLSNGTYSTFSGILDSPIPIKHIHTILYTQTT
ncbi:hypothetical protein BGY98DRAFT_1102511 [Russula aff. rugulosa BPL654]|nr:hypothetical protein BGY98DRAFT_1102511 [Russula aff. rugulosa BPL654]